MKLKRKFIFALAVFLLLLCVGSALADRESPSKYMPRAAKKLLTGDEVFTGVASTIAGPSHAYSLSRANVIGQAGNTWYEYQHNGSMCRQVARDPNGQYIHFLWMRWPAAGGPRHIRYNAYDLNSSTWAWGSGEAGGKDVSGTNGGYTSLDVTPTGAAVGAWHEGPVSTSYASYASKDHNPVLGFFDDYPGNPAPGPPNCQNITTEPPATEGPYIWPQVEFDTINGDEVTHLVCCESPPGDDPSYPQTIVYNRAVNGVWDGCAAGIRVQGGQYVGMTYTVNPVVRSDPNSQRVAIVWLKPMYIPPDPNDPCENTQAQNDVVYRESFDGGVTWGPDTNITDYSLGGTLRTDQMEHQAYTEVTALYSTDGCLHIVWNTPLRNLQGDNPCAPLYASRIWHWDDCNECISLVYDATRPRFFCPTGAFMVSTGKINISQCTITKDRQDRLYVSFSRMGAHTSADGDTCIDCSIGPPDNEFGNFANSDIFLTGSSDGGLTWGPPPAGGAYPVYVDTNDANTGSVIAGTALNATNTMTIDCTPDNCLSEHWGTMAKYNVDVLNLEFIEDHDAGAGIRDDPQEGQLTNNPVIYMQEECFGIEAVSAMAATPLEAELTIAPSVGGRQDGCTADDQDTVCVTLYNTGNVPLNFSASVDCDWITPQDVSGSIPAGCNAEVEICFVVGPFPTEGRYECTITVTADGITIVITLNILVKCYPPQWATLSTACWSIGVWNNARVGDTPDAANQMFWFPTYIPPDGAAFMYDEGVIITFADDDSLTYTPIFNGGEHGMILVPLGPLTTGVFPNYEYAHGLWATGDNEFDPVNDPAVVGEIEYFVPLHPDTCVLVERIKVCNNTDTIIRIKVGEAIDWDIPDVDGNNNDGCGADASEQIVWINDWVDIPPPNYYGTVQFCHDIPGAVVVDNPTWVYPTGGYVTTELGTLLNTQTGFDANCPEADDYSAIYVADRDIVLEPDSCRVYCKVKTSSIISVDDLNDLLDKGRHWIASNGLDCRGRCCCCVKVGDADGSGALDIDDVVYLISHIFSGGPAPVPCETSSGDADSSYGVDIDDVVYLINHIFLGGPPPANCPDWIAGCGY